jgi:esterase/lipase
MHVVIIPGLLGHPNEVAFKDLSAVLRQKRHRVTIIAWPHFPTDLTKYAFSETIKAARELLEKLPADDVVLFGVSMGGIIATYLASEFQVKKLILVVAPYQAGTKDDLEGKYKEWQENGARMVKSSVYGELSLPFSFIEDARTYNALDVIGNVQSQLLVIAGEQDEKVSWSATKMIYDAANEPKEWHLIGGMQHRYQYQSPEMLAKVNAMIVGFIEGD